MCCIYLDVVSPVGVLAAVVISAAVAEAVVEADVKIVIDLIDIYVYLPVREGGASQEGVAVADQDVADGGSGLLACYLS